MYTLNGVVPLNTVIHYFRMFIFLNCSKTARPLMTFLFDSHGIQEDY